MKDGSWEMENESEECTSKYLLACLTAQTFKHNQSQKEIKTMSTATQSSTSDITDTAWPAGNGATILSSASNSSDPLEPSGLTIFTDGDSVKWFYLVSDNGKIARRKFDLSDSWKVESFLDSDHPKQSDFESVCTIGSRLMVGVEGGDANNDPKHAHIKLFNPADTTGSSIGSFTGSDWNLKDVIPDHNDGMEALTFVPDGSYPASWVPASQNGKSLYYGGVFLVAFQCQPGTIYVYDLPQGNHGTQDVNSTCSFTTGLLADRKLSDLFYDSANGTLYALYDDDANTKDELQELQLNGQGITLKYQTQPPYYGCEAVAVDGSTLYLGIDQSSTQWANNGGHGTLTNYVYEFASYTNHTV
jgi:hypothetical protein